MDNRSFTYDSILMILGLLVASAICFWFLRSYDGMLIGLVIAYFSVATLEQFFHGKVVKGELRSNWHRYLSPVGVLILLVLATTLDGSSQKLLGFQLLGVVTARIISMVTNDMDFHSAVRFQLVNFLLALGLTSLIPNFWTLAENPEVFIILLQIGGFFIWLQTGFTLLEFLRIRNSTEREAENAKKENEFYSRLFSLISHNIRNSLSTVLTRVELMRLVMGDAKTLDSFKHHIDPIESGTLEAFRFIDAVFSRNSQATTSKIDTPIGEWLDAVLEDYTSSLSMECIRIETDWTLTQRERIAFDLAMDVFVSNSIKYGAKHVQVTLHNKEIIITDDGPGVAPERLKKLGQSKVVSDSKTGTGSGLMLSNQLLGLVDWKLEISSVQGEGLTIKMIRS